jgi:uncharacterized protein with LGFP repeats
MFTFLRHADQASVSRKARGRARSGDRRRARPRIEALEALQLLSWTSVPPALITPPTNNPPSTYLYNVNLDASGNAHGSNTNVRGEIDFYHFTATQSGTYVFDAASPNHQVDTVIAVYNSSGHRLAYNDDINTLVGNTDSETSVALQAGHQYYFGATNYIANTTHGPFKWSIDGPAIGAIYSAIEAKAAALGSGFTGAPVSALQPAVNGGYYIHFANCDIYDSPATGAHEVHGAIRAEYNFTASETDAYGRQVQRLVGLPTSDEMNVPGVAGARMNTFQGGAIYWSSGTGAHVVYGAILAKYNSLGWAAAGSLPTDDESWLFNGQLYSGIRVQHFENNGSIMWSQATGAHAVYGAILSEYRTTFFETDYYGTRVMQILGAPTSDEMGVPGVPGARMNTFQGGAIYWSPGTGAHVVYGAIGAEYAALAYETDCCGREAQLVLGLPTSDEMNVPWLAGARMNTFQGGAIYWSPGTGAHVVYGGIGGEYAATASETDYYGTDVQRILGLPTSDEMNVPGIAGARMNTFQGGAIYWSPGTGAHVVYGAIGALYQNMGGPTSYLGLPTSDEEPAPTGGRPDYRVSYFQNGKIWWTPGDGAHAVQAVSEIDVGTNGLVSFGGGNPVNAYANLTVYANGDYHFWGNFNNYGWFLGYNDSMVLSLVGTSGAAIYTFVHPGNVGPQHVDSWDEWGYNPLLAANWADLEGGLAYYQADLAWDAGALVQKIIGDVAQVYGWWISTVYTITQNS